MIIFVSKVLRIGRIEDSYLRPVRGNAKVIGPLGGSSNGRTQDSDSCYLGSNPSPPATFTAGFGRLPPNPHWPHRLAVRTSASHADNTSSILVGVTSNQSRLVARLRESKNSPAHAGIAKRRTGRSGRPPLEAPVHALSRGRRAAAHPSPGPGLPPHHARVRAT